MQTFPIISSQDDRPRGQLTPTFTRAEPNFWRRVAADVARFIVDPVSLKAGDKLESLITGLPPEELTL